MQISKLSLLPFLISSALAVPAVVTITQHVHKETTVVVRGALYVTNDQTLTTYYTETDNTPTTLTPQATTVNAVVATVAEGTTVLQPISTTSTYKSVIAIPSTTTAADIVANVSVEQEDDNAANTAIAATAAAASATITTTPASTTTTSDSTVSSTDSLSDNASKLLSAHNNKRALHKDTPSLTWSTELETYAQNYADQYDCSGTLVHSGGPYGENLALGYGIEGAVDAWYSEIKYYNYNNPGFSEDTGHFTQLVWKSSTEVGCGVKSCGGVWGDYVVCSYNPAGNVIGEFPENVMPLA